MTTPPEREGDWIQTYTGVQFWPLDPRSEEVRLEDIAHALSRQCRFSGHVNDWYSVAEHSVHLARFALDTFPSEVRVRMARWALLHDATEAYLVDVPRPIKPRLMGYHWIEARLMRVIAQRYRLEGTDVPVLVRAADLRILFTERRALMGPPPHPWGDEGTEPLPVTIESWGRDQAKHEFLHLAAYLEIRDEA